MRPLARGLVGARGRCGFTLLEVVVVVGVLGVVLGSVGMFQLHGNSAARSQLERSELEARTRRALDRAVDELMGAAQSRLDPDPTDSFAVANIAFQRPDSVSDQGEVVWSKRMNFVLELEPRELANGRDDDGDELVDELRLVLVRRAGEPDEQRVVLCNGVAAMAEDEWSNASDDDGDGSIDEAGFGVRRVGDVLLVHLRLLHGRKGLEPLSVELATSVVVRN
jgi:prepilin-type N-terminal cleavage/methylation domain-containing protein